MSQKPYNTRYVLALDSSMTGCSAAVLDVVAGQHYVRRNESPRGQAEFLVPLAQECVAEAGIDFRDIDLIATMQGPGSFTGLRVALSAAKSFSLALDVPLVGLITTEVLVRQYLETAKHGENRICALVETKRSDYYYQVFDDAGNAVCSVGAAEVEDLRSAIESEQVVLIGDAVERYTEKTQDRFADKVAIPYPDPVIMARLALEKIKSGQELGEIEPLYLRGADVSLPKNASRKMKNY